MTESENPKEETGTKTEETKKTTKVTMTMPKFGGKSGDYVWMGGPPDSDWKGTTRTNPKTPYCFQMTDPTASIKVYARKTQGLSIGKDDQKFTRANMSYSLPSFANDAKRHMESYGMDTVFHMEDNTGEMVNLFEYHN